MNLDMIPKNPGCYLYKNKKGQVIYVGKAKNLSKRVKSYFTKKDLDDKTKQLVLHIHDVEYFITDSEVEALILENNLIKKHYPKYNISLKDAKRYAYLQLTKENFSRVILARKKGKDGKYFGPFISADTRNKVLKFINKTFKLRTCKRFPKKACLRYHIMLCTAPCIKKISERSYNSHVKKAEMVLLGHTKELKKKLKKEMEAESKKQNYEEALEIRKQLQGVEWLSEKQKTERQKKYDEDIINYLEYDGKIYLVLFNIRRGILQNKQEFEFIKSNGILEEFLLVYYSENKIPKEIILPRDISVSLKKYLTMLKNKKITFTVPKKGEKKELMNLVEKNIKVSFFGEQEKVEDLKKKLRMQELPKVIECFDISHLSGTAAAASMVQFRHGKPDKSNYRRFKIKTVDGIDDCASIAEVVRRRYLRQKKEGKEMPDLVLIDGGKPQLNAALSSLREIDVKLPVISIAKRFEEIFIPGLKFGLKFDRKSKGLLYLQEIRNEAHRFAISYNRLLIRKKLKG